MDDSDKDKNDSDNTTKQHLKNRILFSTVSEINVIKLFCVVTLRFLREKARAIDSGNHFHPSLIFTGEAGQLIHHG